MPKQSAKVEFNNFSQGFITEASPLNFPQNATFDELNFEISRKGTRQRRNGMDFEVGYLLNTVVFSQNASTFEWNSVGGNPNLNFIVVHSRNDLLIFDKEQASVSAGILESINLLQLNLGVANLPGGGPAAFDRDWSFASVDGKLIIVSGSELIALITYEDETFFVSYERLKVRDQWGVESSGAEETDVSFRPLTLSDTHNYNLQNQSWGIPRKGEIVTTVTYSTTNADNNITTITQVEEKVIVPLNPITKYFTDLGKYPSNSETVWAGLQFQPVQASVSPYERLFTNLYEDALGADTKAAKGYYIIDLLRRGGSRMEVFSTNQNKHPVMAGSSVNLPNDITPGGPTIVASFAGRIWYAGFSGEVIDGDDRSPVLNNCIFYSQLVRNKADFVKCYQEGDPTSRENNDVIATDGGFLKLTGAENIINMVEVNDQLVIVASNGVWVVRGGSDFGFSATNYSADKLSSFGGNSKQSLVEDGDKVFFWGESGIFVVEKNQVGDTVVNNITEKSIQSYYEDIPSSSKGSAKGVYDPISKTVRWIYKIGTPFTPNSETYELVLNTGIPAFYKNKIMNTSDNSVEVMSLFSSANFNVEDQVETVVVGGLSVLSGGELVILPQTGRINAVQSTRYLTFYRSGGVTYCTFAYYSNPDFEDWATVGAVDAAAYFITGEQTAGDSSVAKQIPYVIMHFVRTEEGVDVDGVPLNQSGCLVKFSWDWANNNNTVKFGTAFQAYKYRRAQFTMDGEYDNGFSVITSRNKVRGRGKAFSMRVDTEPGKDCQILGWSLPLNGNQIA